MHQPELLIIRSVSFQQLDLVLPRLRATFPAHRLVLLTHPHGVATASKYPEIHEIIAFPHKGSFQVWRRVHPLVGRRFDAIVVPVSSLSGGGFFNVFAFAFSLPAKKYLVCNPAGELTDLHFVRIAGYGGRHLAAFLIAGLAALVALPILLILLPCYLAQLLPRKE